MDKNPLIFAMDTAAIMIAVATILAEKGAYIVSLVIFPVLVIASGVNYARKKRKEFLKLQVLFLYLLFMESVFLMVFGGHSRVIILASAISLIVGPLYVFERKRPE